ncbi:MAG: hypothetical protein DWQ06_13660 [Calditrichaeota bacterium]|nr:MAG: hypothetical protein DWQ06_13660 [Calditrichota bacterium]
MQKEKDIKQKITCRICELEKKINVEAKYEGNTIEGFWANMCQACFSKYGVGLGVRVVTF